MSEDLFISIGQSMFLHAPLGSALTCERRFRSLFGTSPLICSIVWGILKSEIPPGGEPRHLLWALLFLKTYGTEHTLRVMTKVDEKTQRKWVWLFIELISSIDVIDWESRLIGKLPGEICFASLDGTDFHIYEPTPFDKKWYSHKFHGPGIRYEIGLCIRTGHIVWAHGGKPCGAWPDLRLARDAFVDMLLINEGERALADRGYRDPQYFIHPGCDDIDQARQKEIMARHETVNRRLKQFGVLSQRFRHTLRLHPICFHAVVNLTQLMIENGEELYAV